METIEIRRSNFDPPKGQTNGEFLAYCNGYDIAVRGLDRGSPKNPYHGGGEGPNEGHRAAWDLGLEHGQLDVKPHLSFSQINMFLRCPRQYYYKYILGETRPPSGAMMQSKCWHQAVEANYEQKIVTGQDMPLDEVQSIFSDRFDHDFHETEFDLGVNETVHGLKDQGVEITTEHHLTIAPTVTPKHVEHPFRISLGEEFPYDLLGYWDLIEDDDRIVDNKAYKRTPSQKDLDKDLQFTAYSAGFRVSEGRIEPGLRMDAVVKNKKPKTVQLYTTRTNQEIQWFFRLVEQVTAAIKSENFFPNPQGWHCSPDFCGYWNQCKGE